MSGGVSLQSLGILSQGFGTVVLLRLFPCGDHLQLSLISLFARRMDNRLPNNDTVDREF